MTSDPRFFYRNIEYRYQDGVTLHGLFRTINFFTRNFDSQKLEILDPDRFFSSWR